MHQFPLWKLYKSSLFFSLSTLLIFEVIPHYSYDLHIPDDSWCEWASFHVSHGHLYVFFGNMFRSSTHFLIRLLIFWCWVVWVLCIFWILSIARYIVCKCLIPFSRLPLHFVDSFFYGIKAFTWCSPVCLFLLLLLAWWDISKNSAKTNV